MENLSNKLNEYPRDCNYYQDRGENYGYVVIPAGKVDIGEGHFVNFYHTIFEDAHSDKPNGEYKLVDEQELNEMLNY
mgnify:FL=1